MFQILSILPQQLKKALYLVILNGTCRVSDLVVLRLKLAFTDNNEELSILPKQRNRALYLIILNGFCRVSDSEVLRLKLAFTDNNEQCPDIVHTASATQKGLISHYSKWDL